MHDEIIVRYLWRDVLQLGYPFSGLYEVLYRTLDISTACTATFNTQSSTLIGLFDAFGTMMFTQGDCMLIGRSKCRVGAHICIRNVQNPYDKLEVSTKPGVTEDSLLVEISLRIRAMV